ncbi:MAG: hypothetical protein Q7T21_04680 [Gallionella sp.]|nr:hypothetical protein [Gallionella sp.]
MNIATSAPTRASTHTKESDAMTNFTVTVQDTGVHAALAALAKRVNNMPAVLDTIGTGIIERTKRR